MEKKSYFFILAESAFMAESFIIESFAAVVSAIFMPVSIAAGAGAIAAPVSTGASSFLVHAARARTATTSAMRFIWKSPGEGANVIKRRSVHASRDARCWRGEKVIVSEMGVKRSSTPAEDAEKITFFG
jgi:hypothetical protein